VITNLVSNAIKYGAQGPVEITLSRAAERVRIVVRDHGIGIPPEDLSRIFERFERGRTPKGTGGFGLGLWIVAQAVAVLGGTVQVESDVGKGSTFAVELPVQEADPSRGRTRAA
jgi:signal transduction histidine kinase